MSAPRLHRPPRRSIAHPQQQQLNTIVDKETATEIGDTQPEPPLALTKEALERNARKAGPRPDLQRRVSRFLEEISEAEEPLEDASLLSRDEEAQIAEPASAAAARVDHAPVAAASEPVANVTDATPSGVLAPHSLAAPAPEQQAQVAATAKATTLPAAKAQQPKLVGKVTNQSTLVRRARTDVDDLAPHGTKKPRREPATAAASVVTMKPTSATTTAAVARPRGKENGAAPYSVAAELEKQLHARLEWSERQKRREEEAKRFRQRQRDEEAVRSALPFSCLSHLTESCTDLDSFRHLAGSRAGKAGATPVFAQSGSPEACRPGFRRPAQGREDLGCGSFSLCT